jgi:hypothetical protein
MALDDRYAETIHAFMDRFPAITSLRKEPYGAIGLVLDGTPIVKVVIRKNKAGIWKVRVFEGSSILKPWEQPQEKTWERAEIAREIVQALREYGISNGLRGA